VLVLFAGVLKWAACFWAFRSDPDEAFVMVSAGLYHTPAITSSGRAVCWGAKVDGQVSGIPKFNFEVQNVHFAKVFA
jgi:hypothetical protein